MSSKLTASPRSARPRDGARTPAAATATAPAPFYEGRSYSIDGSYGYLLRRLYSSIQRHVDKRMQPLDLTAMQWAPLLLLAEGKGNTAAELARVMDIDTGAMTRMLDRLEGKGLVARARSSADRRVVHLELTPDGLKVARRIPNVVADVLNLHLRDFELAELKQFMGFLQRMLVNGGAAATERRP